MPFDAELLDEPRTRPRKKRHNGKRQGERSLTAQTAWLDGRLLWRDGRVIWQLNDKAFAPTHAELSLAHYNLTRLQKLVERTGEVDVELAALTERRKARFQLARQLRDLHAPDYSRLASASRSRNPAATERLVELLTAEALCLNPLPGPDGLQPSQALLRNSELTRQPLLNYLRQPAMPQAGRVLAALVLGALTARNHRDALTHIAELDSTELRRAYAFGQQYGVTDSPALTAALLVAKGGVSLAHRCTQALESAQGDFCNSQLLREGLATGRDVSDIVALAENAAQVEANFKKWRQLTAKSALKTKGHTKRSIKRLREDRQDYLHKLCVHLGALIKRGYDAEVLTRALQFVEVLFEKQVQNITRSGLSFSTVSQDYLLNTALYFGLLTVESLEENSGCDRAAGLRFLIEQADTIWIWQPLKQAKDAKATVKYLFDAFDSNHYKVVTPLLKILHHCKNEELCLRCHQSGYLKLLSKMQWDDPDSYHLFFALLARWGKPAPGTTHYWVEEMADFIQWSPSLHSARHALSRLIDDLQQCPPELRDDLFYEILSETRYPRMEGFYKLSSLLPVIDKVIEFRTKIDDSSLCDYLLYALVTTHQQFRSFAPEESDGAQNVVTLQRWMIDELLTQAGQSNAGLHYELLSTMIDLLGLLSRNDIAQFQYFFKVALRLQFRDTNYNLQEGLDRLKNYPALITILATNFARQPLRCLNFVARLGLFQTLPTPLLAPLAAFKENNALEPTADGPIWPAFQSIEDTGRRLEIQALALRLQRAQDWLNEPQELPPGVERALELPQKMRRELEHLEGLVAQQPDSVPLKSRIASLRAQLANDSYLSKRVADEIHDALQHVTAETEMRAIEKRLLDCVRLRLEEVVGPISRDAVLDDDLINAVLLTTDVETNRKLLRRLLRCHLEGDRLWHHRHPANQLFLNVMGAHNLNVERWLAAHPKRYPCPGTEGGTVHLRLERQPLRILQMGNYFHTCLSVGGCNSFSTVANACELNKRVVFATDGTGRVVGRQLIGVNEQGKLVGFYVYSSLNGKEAGTKLNRIFLHYVQNFATTCGLELADEGQVPVLFAQDWYDDGVVAWDKNHPRKTTKKL